MTIHHLTYLDSISFLPMALRKLPEAFGLAASKLWYPHFFNTLANRDYVGPIPVIEQYGADHMSESVRKNFMRGIICRRTMSLITGTCCINTAKMTSLSYDRRVRCFVEIS